MRALPPDKLVPRRIADAEAPCWASRGQEGAALDEARSATDRCQASRGEEDSV